MDMKPGDTLPNGAIVIAASARRYHEWVILAVRPEHTMHPYVTWKARRPGDGADTHAGHYSADIFEAVQDFLGR